MPSALSSRRRRFVGLTGTLASTWIRKIRSSTLGVLTWTDSNGIKRDRTYRRDGAKRRDLAKILVNGLIIAGMVLASVHIRAIYCA